MKIPKGFSLPEEHYVISETDIVEILKIGRAHV